MIVKILVLEPYFAYIGTSTQVGVNLLRGYAWEKAAKKTTRIAIDPAYFIVIHSIAPYRSDAAAATDRQTDFGDRETKSVNSVVAS